MAVDTTKKGKRMLESTWREREAARRRPVNSYRGQVAYPNGSVLDRALRNALADEGVEFPESEPLFDEHGEPRWEYGKPRRDPRAYDGRESYDFDSLFHEAVMRADLARAIRYASSPEEAYMRLFEEGRLRRETTYGMGVPANDPDYEIQSEAWPPQDPKAREAWDRLRALVLKRDHYSCQRCGLKGKDNLSPHHIVPRSEGGADLQTNLISLCHPCHDWVEIQRPRLRKRAEIEGSENLEADKHALAVAAVEEEVAQWYGKRKPYDLLNGWADRLERLNLVPAAILEILGVSEPTLRKARLAGT